jgi:hypothetical protein
MKKLAVCVVLAYAPLIYAGAPPTDESMLALFRAMKAESMVESIYATLEPTLRQSISQAAAGKTLTDDQKRVLELAQVRMNQLLRTELTWEKLQPIQLAIYREHFDQAEIDGLLAFYKSPVGESVVNKMPAVTMRSMASTQAYLQQVLPKIKAAMDQVMQEATLTPR